jgi:hypothetical protein
MSDPPQKDPDAEYGDEPGIAHFQRPDNRYIDYEPPENLFEILSAMDESTLRGLGLQPWYEEKTHWLFPVEWYEHIPEGFEVRSITGRVEPFSRDTHQKEARFGALPYGITLPDYEEPEDSGLEMVE